MLIECKECGNEISHQAISCPNCGWRIPHGLREKSDSELREEIEEQNLADWDRIGKYIKTLLTMKSLAVLFGLFVFVMIVSFLQGFPDIVQGIVLWLIILICFYFYRRRKK